MNRKMLLEAAHAEFLRESSLWLYPIARSATHLSPRMAIEWTLKCLDELVPSICRDEIATYRDIRTEIDAIIDDHTIAPDHIERRAEEIWYSVTSRTSMTKGMSHAYGAVLQYRRNELARCANSLAAAIAVLVSDAGYRPEHFEIVSSLFLKQFGEN